MTNRIVTVFGQKGAGKTSRAIMEARSLDRVIFFDPRRQVPGSEGLIFIEAIPAMRYYVLNFKKKFRIVYQPIDETEELSFVEGVRGFYDLTVVFDEVDTLSYPAVSWGDPIEHIYRYGRHQKIDIIATARRPAEISRTVTQATDEFIVFHTHEPRDIEYFSKALSVDYAEKIKALASPKPGENRIKGTHFLRIVPGSYVAATTLP